MNRIFASSSFSTDSENISDNIPKDPNIASSNIIVSIVTVVAISTATIAAPVLTAAPVIKGISEIKNQNISNYSQAETKGMYFSNKENRDDIIAINNDKLEVDDLADKITQAQLNEIKEHFDTKIKNLQSNITLEYEKYADKKFEELKEYISSENDKIKTTKKETRRFWIAAIIAPILVVIVQKFFGI